MNEATQKSGRDWKSILGLLYTLILLWLVGASLRITVLAIPPIIPMLHADLHLSQTAVGILTGLPPLLFACAAIPGAALIARFGILRMLVCGLLLTAAAAALRGAAPNVMTLFAMTFVMGAGIAIMQPAVPPIVRQWLPHRIGFATAIYANGMQVGETLSASLTLPLILPMTGNSWRWSLAFWSLPVLLTAFLIILRARRSTGSAKTTAAGGRRHWWPDWKDPLTWKVGLIVGGASCIFFGTQAFLPDFLARSGRADLISGALAALTATQVITTVILLFTAQHLILRRSPFLITGIFAVIGITGLLLTSGAWVLFWSGLIGVCCALTFTLGMSIPASIAAPDDVPRISAAVFTISYSSAFLIPALGGISWDLSGAAATAFIPVGLCGLLIMIVGATLNFGTTHSKKPA